MAWYDTREGDAAEMTTGQLPSARLDIGTGPSQLIQLDGSSRLPAVDGSQLTGIPGATPGEDILATVASVDLNSTAKQVLYTVPAGKTGIVTKVIVTLASSTPGTANVDFGFNANADDVIDNIKFNQLDSTTKFAMFHAEIGAETGAAASDFGVKISTGLGAGITATMAVFGYEV